MLSFHVKFKFKFLNFLLLYAPNLTNFYWEHGVMWKRYISLYLQQKTKVKKTDL